MPPKIRLTVLWRTEGANVATGNSGKNKLARRGEGDRAANGGLNAPHVQNKNTTTPGLSQPDMQALDFWHKELDSCMKRLEICSDALAHHSLIVNSLREQGADPENPAFEEELQMYEGWMHRYSEEYVDLQSRVSEASDLVQHFEGYPGGDQ
jgi:hypothetical protein